MRRISKLLSLAILSGLFLNSCSNDDDIVDPVEPQPEGTYTDGFFVLNEGSSGGGNVSFVNNDLQNIEQEIFQTVNNGEDVGLYTQSIFFNDEHAFIISNGSNLISVVDRYTFELIGKIENNLNIPMYGAVENGKAYVTNLASFDTDTDDFVAVINLETLEVEETIVMNATAEYIMEKDGLLYVKNASYGTGNQISVINPTTNSIENTYETNTGLSDFDVQDGFIYALSTSKLEKIDIASAEIVSYIEFAEGNAGKMDIEDEIIYYTIGSAVYRIEVNDLEAAEDPILDYNVDSSYAVYGFEVEEGNIYMAEAHPSFTANGTIRVYTLNGDLSAEFDSGGIGPNGFYFND
ncbi:YncE family protein [Salegentibacter sp. Hel_I_6]|uniref:YncE family protein n=1 Tax=Salegentibacter sp. Hel_I_6 TaxID=1250278 RepID=UPI0005643D84|nr:DUF5074 domain-containing protein [Salegentibacter sp. Hel_I_6]